MTEITPGTIVFGLLVGLILFMVVYETFDK